MSKILGNKKICKSSSDQQILTNQQRNQNILSALYRKKHSQNILEPQIHYLKIYLYINFQAFLTI